MSVESVMIHNHTVFRDESLTYRWYDAFGPHVTKWLVDAVRYTADNYTVTAVEAGAGSATITQVDGALGGNLLFTAAGNEDDGVQAQLLGEAFYLSGSYPCYFGVRFKLADVDQTDALVGLAVQDTTVITAVADGLYFRTVDESAVLSLVAENTNVETSLAADTLADDTWVVAEFYYDGVSEVEAYIDGVSVGSIALTDANFPDDEYLSPVLAMLTGEAVANTMNVDWARAIQIHA